MELTKETFYGTRTKKWVARIDGDVIANGETKDAAQRDAEATLHNAFTYLTRSGTARVATDGTVIVFRQIGEHEAMYEFVRDGRYGSGSCLGRMTTGFGESRRNLTDYADYVIARYNEAIAPTEQNRITDEYSPMCGSPAY